MSLQTLAAWGGSELIDDTDLHSETEIKAFYVREDTVIARLEDNSSPGVDMLAEMNLSGKTLIQGDLFFAKEGQPFQQFQLTSGSVIVYR